MKCKIEKKMNDTNLNTEKSNEVKFKTNDFLEAVEKASIRSRKILILMIFSSLLILMALVNSIDPKYNWFISRFEIVENAAKYFYFDDDKIDSLAHYHILKTKTVSSLEEYISINEAFYKTNRSYLTNKIHKEIPNFNVNSVAISRPTFQTTDEKSLTERFAFYKELSKSLDYILSHGIRSRSEINEKINSLNSAKIEHINLVRVPILGISFDINYLGIYTGFALLILYWLLYSSLKREHVNTKIAFKREWSNNKDYHSYYFYEYISMMQVLNMPRKLFEPVSKPYALTQNGVAVISLIAPFLVYLFVLWNDILSFDLGIKVNHCLTWISFFLEVGLIVLTFLLFRKVILQWRKMDVFWNNQTIEYNFEFILECLGEDPQVDLIPLADNVMIEKDKHTDDIKKMWCISIVRMKRNRKISEAASLKLFSLFINQVLSLDFKNAQKCNLNEEEIDLNWENLVNWFKSYREENNPVRFGKSLHLFMMSYK